MKRRPLSPATTLSPKTSRARTSRRRETATPWNQTAGLGAHVCASEAGLSISGGDFGFESAAHSHRPQG